MKTPEQIAQEVIPGLPSLHYAIVDAIEADRAQRDMADYRVGYPDPTLEDHGPGCGDEHEDGWLCTRRPGHPGPHVARTGERIAGVW